MKKRKSILASKAAGFILAAVMLLSVIMILPDEVKADEYSFNGSGTSEVTISDEACRLASKNKSFHWIRFRPKKTGSITITAMNASASSKKTNGYIVLCDASKNFLDYTSDYYTTANTDARYYNITYGVKAKTTYYFRIESSAGVRFRATVSSISKKNAGKTRKKAKTINQNKNIKGVIVAGDKTTDWYKLRLTQRKKVELSFTAKTNGWDGQNGEKLLDGIRFTFCDSKGRMFAENAYHNLTRGQTKSAWGYYLTREGSKKKLGLNPGTYYIKVKRLNNSSSGEYTLKWKMY